MANQQILKLIAALGGGASEGYGQGNLQKVGGQPLLPKPQMSMPDALSPYAPGNQGGGMHAQLGGMALPNAYGADSFDASKPSPNKTAGVVHPQMRESANHPAAQLAQYLTTIDGASPRARLKKTGTDPGEFLRGGQ